MSKGLKSIETENGIKIEVQEKIAVSLPKRDINKRLKALDWIRNNGGAPLISNDLLVSDPEEGLKHWLIEHKIPFQVKQDIHYARLKSFISGKLGMKKGSLPEIETSDVPSELNLFIYNETKIKG